MIFVLEDLTTVRSSASSWRHEHNYIVMSNDLLVMTIRCCFGYKTIVRGGGKGSDEEHTTCSGGTNPEEGATARLAQGSVGRQVAQTHHENLNLTFSTFSQI